MNAKKGNIAVVLFIVIASAGWLGARTRIPTDPTGEMRVRQFGSLPVVFQGRVKPYDTLARNSLLILSDKQTYRDEDGNRQPAIKWLLDVISNHPGADSHQVFRIENLEVLSRLELTRRPGFTYALAEFSSKRGALDQLAASAGRKPQEQRDTFDRAAIELANHVFLFDRIQQAHETPRPPGSEEALNAMLSRYSNLLRFPLPHAIPPAAADEEWKPYMRAAVEGMVSQNPNPMALAFGRMLTARRAEDVEKFNTTLAAYQTLLTEQPPPSTDMLQLELLFNHFEPFYHCTVLYVLAFLLSIIAWLGWSATLNRAAFWLIAFVFLIHTAGLVARVYISGYPPVTTLYSSAIFIGWGSVVLCLILEAIYKLGIANTIGAVAGALTLIIAHLLSGDGDTFEMMQAVLDTKFWLATHVVTITLGYTASFVAGLFAVFYILRGVFSRALTPEIEQNVSRMIYGTICFAMLLSFVGTVLGGLWADDSWGRFWGWDPKENGALLIVLWNALILHARWGGVIKRRGVAVLAVGGNIVTAWSWFGVNQLGVGLHSYGFTSGVWITLLFFWSSQLVIIACGLIPRAMWRSSPRGKTKTAAVANADPAMPLPTAD